MLSHTLRLCATLLLGAAFLAPRAHAQFNDLSIYGFFQTQGQYSEAEFTMGPASDTDETLSFSVQQLNLFLANQFSPSFSAFVNAEIRNTLSTAQGFGELRLEEAWLRYNHSSELNVKAGRLIPTFNNLNEIKNRTPLLPYVSRPIVYESSMHGILPMDQFVPDHAYLQVYGAVPTGNIRVDYAAYVGNSDNSYLAGGGDLLMVAGTDTSLAKAVGGRLGARWRGVKAGVSGTYDKRLHSDVPGFDPATGAPTAPIPGTGLGDMQRTRFGADLSFTVGRLFGEAEAIQVLYHFDDEQQAQVEQNVASFLMFSESMDASFAYGLLGVNITEEWYAYGRYDYYGDESFDFGIDTYSLGGGFRPIDQVALKVQYVNVATRENALFELGQHSLYGAVSVQF